MRAETARLKLCPDTKLSHKVLRQLVKPCPDTKPSAPTFPTIRESLGHLQSRQRVQILDERADCAVQPRNLGIGGVDDVVLVGRVCAGAVAEAEVPGGKAERRVGEDVSRPGAGGVRPQQGVLS